MQKVVLRCRYDAAVLSHMCHNYGSTSSEKCPAGGFVCPFVHQNEDGAWIMEKGCRDVSASDWKKVLKEERPEER